MPIAHLKPENTESLLVRQLQEAIRVGEIELVQQLILTARRLKMPAVEQELLEADLGELTEDERRRMRLTEQMLKLERKHNEKVWGDPNYGMGGNNRPSAEEFRRRTRIGNE